ncbi:MAG: hypothetical protein AB8B62_06360 [Roseobacter sp.]
MAALCLGTSALAQGQPLSVIDWVKRNPDTPPMTSAVIPKTFEPPVAPGVSVPAVTVHRLDGPARQMIGIVPASVTGLPQSLWTGSMAAGLVAQINDVPLFRLPAAQALLYTVMLTEAEGPGSDAENADLLTLARVGALTKFGAHDPAIAMLRQAGVTRDRAHFAAYMDATLLTGGEDRACAILAANPHLAPSLAHRSFCAARESDWPTAALLFDTGQSIGAIDGAESAALERFLHIEAYEDAPPLRRPSEITPLIFRLHEAIGEPLPTGSLPRAYAVADLRDLAGWKPQLEAAERLAVSGALPASRLLGLYTARQAAASGGVWERVRAVQRFENAFRARSPEAISENLPPAWHEMQRAGLEIPFADLFAEALTRYTLEGDAARVAQVMHLLSADYKNTHAEAVNDPLLYGALTGDMSEIAPESPRDAALSRGFDVSNARSDLVAMARNGRMGEAILRALVLLDDGAAGDSVALTQALATLRAFGLEDTVRRAALQILLLERYS